MRVLTTLSWLALPLLLAGCLTASPRGESSGFRPAGDVQALPASTAQTVSDALQAAAASPVSSDYRLGPLDIIEVSVFEVPELTKTVQINAGGLISLPLIGTVAAGGRTISELERDIQQKLAADYLQSPQVSVLVKEYTSQRITVEGAVNSPGIYPISGRTTLLQTIALAKGPDRTADESGVIIFRAAPDGSRQAAVFDLGPIRSGEAPDPVVLGGDIVVVDQSAVRTAWRDLRESIGVLGFFRPTVF